MRQSLSILFLIGMLSTEGKGLDQRVADESAGGKPTAEFTITPPPRGESSAKASIEFHLLDTRRKDRLTFSVEQDERPSGVVSVSRLLLYDRPRRDPGATYSVIAKCWFESDAKSKVRNLIGRLHVSTKEPLSFDFDKGVRGEFGWEGKRVELPFVLPKGDHIIEVFVFESVATKQR